MGNLYTSTTFMEHNSHPDYKYEMDAPTHEHDGINPSCGDDIVLKLKVEDGVITDGAFVGDGCAISQASADIMLDLIIGEKKEDALHLAELFLKMIKDSITEEEMEELEALGALIDGPSYTLDGKEVTSNGSSE